MNTNMISNKFYIAFDDPDQTYFGGQTVSGKVFIYMASPIKTKELVLNICGIANVQWTEFERIRRNSTSSDKRGMTYKASEIYLDETIYFCGTPYEEVTLNGYKELTFSFILPTGLPATFTSNTAKVSYFCSAKIERSWKFDLHCKTPFIVQCPYDLNLDPNARESVSDEDSVALSCWFCKNGFISISGNLTKRGYTPGEFIPISGEIINKSSIGIKKTRAALTMIVTTFASGQNHNEEREISFIEKGRVEAQHTEFWTGIPLEVPDLEPTHLGMSSCRVLDVQYYIDFSAEMDGLFNSLKVRLPIIIGNMPLTNDLPRQVSAPPSPALPSPALSDYPGSRYQIYSDTESVEDDELDLNTPEKL